MKRAREHAALDDFVETIFKRRKLSNSSHNQTFAGVHNMLPQHRNTFSEIAKNTTTNPSLMHNVTFASHSKRIASIHICFEDVIAEFRLLELSDEASKAIFESGVDAFFEHQLPSVLKNVWMAVWVSLFQTDKAVSLIIIFLQLPSIFFVSLFLLSHSCFFC
jgi:hypothetical protein